MASLVRKVTKALELEPGERVLCAALSPKVGDLAPSTRRPGGYVPAVAAGIASGVSVAFRPGEFLTSFAAGSAAGLIASVAARILESKRGEDENASTGVPVVVVTDRRLLYAGRSALRKPSPGAWRSRRFDEGMRFEVTERRRAGVVLAYVFDVFTPATEPLRFELQRPRDAEGFKKALERQVVPARPI